jgi:hypothetical protein
MSEKFNPPDKFITTSNTKIVYSKAARPGKERSKRSGSFYYKGQPVLFFNKNDHLHYPMLNKKQLVKICKDQFIEFIKYFKKYKYSKDTIIKFIVGNYFQLMEKFESSAYYFKIRKVPKWNVYYFGYNGFSTHFMLDLNNLYGHDDKSRFWQTKLTEPEKDMFIVQEDLIHGQYYTTREKAEETIKYIQQELLHYLYKIYGKEFELEKPPKKKMRQFIINNDGTLEEIFN